MAGMDSLQFATILQRYAATHPKRATYTGDTFVLKMREPLGMLPRMIFGAVFVIFLFVALTMFGLSRVGGGSQPLIQTFFFVPLVLFVLSAVGQMVARTRGVTIDLNTGDLTQGGLLTKKSWPSLRYGHSFNMQDDPITNSGRTRHQFACQVNFVVDGQPSSETLAYFQTRAGFDEFAPVASALLQRFSTDVAPTPHW